MWLFSLTLALTAADIAFVGANVIPMDRERVLRNHTVVIRDGKIAEVAPSSRVKLAADAVRIDAKGKYLVPGIAEMHGHLPPAQADEETTRRVMALYALSGVTTVRGMLGAPTQVALRERVAKGEVFGPTLFVAGPALSGQSAPTADAGQRLVRESKAAGFDLLKIHEGLTLSAFTAIVEAAKEHGMKFGGHVANDVGLERSLALGQGTIEHLDGFIEAMEAANSPLKDADAAARARGIMHHVDESRLPALVKATLKAKAWVTPTMTVWSVIIAAEKLDDLKARPELKYVSKSTVEQWIAGQTKREALLNDFAANQKHAAIRNRILKSLSDAGVGVLLGSDAPQVFQVPGFSLLREMEFMRASGLKPYKILESGTRNPAVYFGKEAEFGTVQTGRRADLILLEGNPLDDIANMRRQAGVMVRGRWLPASEIRDMLAKLEVK